MLVEKIESLLEKDNIFLTGGGGVGKSYLTKEIVKNAKKKGYAVVVLGSTGVSAVNIEGQTIHSFFAFGISSTLDELNRNDRYVKNRLIEIKKILSSCDLLVIDEISMVSSELLDMILYRVRNSDFSGRVLFVGDFFQLPPVFKKGSDTLFNSKGYAFESSAWEVFNPIVVELTKTKRTDDETFFNALNRIRRADIDDELLSYLKNFLDFEPTSENTTLYGRNKEAEEKNILELNSISGELIKIKANEKEHTKGLHVNKIDNWKKSLPIPFELNLKIGAKVLFCANRWGKYFNGERGVIRDVADDYILVEKENSLVKVQRQEYTMSENVILDGEIEQKPLYSIEQYPLKLAYAVTVHKSQGMSIENLTCNIDNIFERSQFYVALSRASNPKKLSIVYNGGDFERYMKKIIRVAPEVVQFYSDREILKIEEDMPI